MSSFSEMFNSHRCTYCQDEISGLRVVCADCTNFTLCLQCFSVGAEVGPHKNNHFYQFADTESLTVVSKSGWTASEELLLLDAIENYGYGNWEDIANHIETRTPEEAKEEYVNRFLEGSIGCVTWEPAASKRPELTDKTKTDNGPLGPAVISKLPPLDVTVDEAALLGYMPQRDDFEKEYDNTAELLVSTLSITPNEDNELDVALKLAQVDMYINSLRERMRRKRVVRDYQLVSQFFVSRKERPPRKKLSKEQREFEDKFRPFCQFMTANEHNQLLNNLRREHELRRRMKELIRYRKNGITTLDECVEFCQLSFNEEDSIKNSDSIYSTLTYHRLEEFIKNEERNDFYLPIRKSISYTEHQPTSPLSTLSTEDVPIPIHDDISVSLLNPAEIELCIANNLYPSQYISLKTQFINKGIENIGTISDTVKSVFSYLVSKKWIKS